MKYDFYITNNPNKNMTLSLLAVWRLEADEAYNVNKNIDNAEYVALRTVEGSGKLLIEGLEPIIVAGVTLIIFKHRDIRNYHCNSSKWNFWWFEFFMEDRNTFPINQVFKVDNIDFEYIEFNACMKLLMKNTVSSTAGASSLFCSLLYRWLMSSEREFPYESLS